MESESNKTILCTLGPASLNAETIQRPDQFGVDLFRLNLSHTRVDQLEGLIGLIRTNSNVPICLDTQGAQVRTGPLPDDEMTLTRSMTVTASCLRQHVPLRAFHRAKSNMGSAPAIWQ